MFEPFRLGIPAWIHELRAETPVQAFGNAFIRQHGIHFSDLIYDLHPRDLGFGRGAMTQPFPGYVDDRLSVCRHIHVIQCSLLQIITWDA